MEEPAYVELVATSNFSFLHGASHPQELVEQAAMLGLAGLGLADVNSLAGVVRGFTALRDLGQRASGLRYCVGARLRFADQAPDIVAYPADRAGYGRLCQMLSQGNLRTEKGQCTLGLGDLEAHHEGLLLIVVPPRDFAAGRNRVSESLTRLAQLAPGRVWLAASATHDGQDRARLAAIAQMAEHHGLPLIATNDVLYHVPERRPLQDVLTCIRNHLSIEAAGRLLEKNAERHLKSPAEMARLFRDQPQALAETLRLAERIGFSLDQLRHNYPQETVGNGETAQQTLERLSWAGAHKRFPKGIPATIATGIRAELALIAQKHYAPYFLTVEDIVRHARHDLGILCQGRGSAANSIVCYCLEITEVDPVRNRLVFGRFLSTEREEPPDIDVDFEHERREEVIAYIYAKYGRARTALTANVITYRSRSALRDVGKVFGLSEDRITAMNGLSWGGWSSEGVAPDRVRALGLDPEEPRLKLVLALTRDLMGFPRHLSQHVGGFVITRDRLDHLIPLSNTAMDTRTIIEWNKDDLDALDILKVDVLALGMLTCLRQAFALLRTHYGRDLTLHGVIEMAEDGDSVFRMTHRADTVGVFQIESRAQMSMLPRLRPNTFYDLVIEVAIVRPGPIQGGMVHPYLKRRLAGEKIEYPSPALADVLERTLGVPLFQEQAMQIAVVGAGFSPGEADQLRRSMATWRRNGNIGALRERFLRGMAENGYSMDFAQSCFRQIEGFGEYGFPESHAASFALLVYVSCWLKCHYPDVFAAALLNSQPLGFYAPAQIVRDAREHGIEARPVDVNFSTHEARLEADDARRVADHIWPRHAEMKPDIWSTHALRLGFNQIKGIAQADGQRIAACRAHGAYGSVRDLWLRTGLSLWVLEKLADADAFRSLGLTRRAALWAVKGLRGAEGAQTLPLFAAGQPGEPLREPDRPLPVMTAGEEVVHDYRSLALSLKGHPMGFFRAALARKGVLSAAQLGSAPHGKDIVLAGLVLVRQRPGTASGVIFLTLEDETGQANVVVWKDVYTAYRGTLLGARVIAVEGRVQREGAVIHIVARHLHDLTPWLAALVKPAPDDHEAARPDGLPDTGQGDVHGQRSHSVHTVMPRGRNFH